MASHTRARVFARLGSVAVAMLLLGSTACGSGADTPVAEAGPRPILVGAFDFDESQVLAQIYATTMHDHGYPVEVLENVASREIMEPALEQGKVDFVPEYLGTALSFIDPGTDPSYSTPESTHLMLSGAFARKGVEVLDLAPAENKNEVVVTSETAKRYHLSTISDLKKVADELVFGGPPECPTRPHCLGGLESTYNLKFESFLPLDSGGPLTVAALRGGEIDVALLFTTTPQIDEFKFKVLHDDRHLQPAENVVPVVRQAVLAEQGPELEQLINTVSSNLTKERLRDLNRRVEDDPASVVAREWLDEIGLGGR